MNRQPIETAPFSADRVEPAVSLLPCPFCGGLKIEVGDLSGDVDEIENMIDGPIIRQYAVQCLDCICMGPIVVTEHEAASEWNKRANAAVKPRRHED